MGAYERWNALEELAIKDLFMSGDIKGIRSILSAATALTCLELDSGSIVHPDSNDDICLPSLRHLKLIAVDEFWPIDCRNLTHLTLEWTPDVDELADRSIRLPHLVELIYVSMKVENDLRVFDVPSLRTFDFKCLMGKAGSAMLFKSIWPDTTSLKGQANVVVSNIEPQLLSLRNTDINSKVLARSLAGRMLLEDLSMIEVEITTEFFDGLLPVQLQKQTKKSQKTQRDGGPAWRVGCVALKRLAVDLFGRKLKQEQAVVEESARRLLAARNNAGFPFERLAIRFSKEESWKELADEEVEV